LAVQGTRSRSQIKRDQWKIFDIFTGPVGNKDDNPYRLVRNFVLSRSKERKLTHKILRRRDKL
jgi:hypothetical protein